MKLRAAMSTIDPARRRGAGNFLRALIGEATRRARRRRSRYAAAVLSVAIIAGVVFAIQQSPPSSPSGSPAADPPTSSGIQLDPTRPNIVYRRTLGDDTHEGGVWKSTDAGKTWTGSRISLPPWRVAT